MFSRNFKETNEDRENVDKKVDNIEKPRNQILAVCEKYNDDFDKKLDEKEKNDGNDGMKSNGFFSKMRQRYSKIEDSFEKTEDSENKNKKRSIKQGKKELSKIIRMESLIKKLIKIMRVTKMVRKSNTEMEEKEFHGRDKYSLLGVKNVKCC